MFGLYSMIEPEKKISEIELVLNQLNPTPPDRDLKRKDLSEKALPVLEKLIQFKKEGLIIALIGLAVSRRSS